MLRLLRIAIGFGAIALPLWVVVSSSSFQSCIQQKQNQTTADNFQEYISALPITLGDYRGCLGAFIHDSREEIIAAFTVILAFSTIFLWLATRDLVDGAESTAKRQLRAYLSVMPSGLRKISPTENFPFSFVILNGGQTPAYSVSQSGDLILVGHPLPENFLFPELTMARGSKTMVPPNTPFTGHLLATQQFTKDEIIEILEGKATGGKRLYVFGQIDYLDAFKKAHWTRYCFSFPGWHEAVVFARGDQWRDIATILDKPGFVLPFEIAPQHNVTDDG